MPDIAPDALRQAILSACATRGPAKTVCPSEVARDLAGSNETIWRLLMKPIRREAVRLAKEGEIVIRRKGQIVDPDAFKGIYRLALRAKSERDGSAIDADHVAGDSFGAGTSDPIRPANQ